MAGKPQATNPLRRHHDERRETGGHELGHQRDVYIRPYLAERMLRS